MRLLPVFSIAFFLLVLGCSKQNPHVGKWHTEQSFGKMKFVSDSDVRPDGTYTTVTTVQGNTITEEGTWTATDKTYTYKVLSRNYTGPQAQRIKEGVDQFLPLEDTSEYKPNGPDKMIFTTNGQAVVATRVK